MSKGVIIYSFKKATYGKLAWNLAVSIKQTSPNIPVAVLVHGEALSHLEDWRKAYFDHIIEMADDDVYEAAKFMPGKAKLSGYKYFPFDENIIIDADSIVIGNLNSFLDKCTKDIHCQAVGKFNQSHEQWTCQWMPFNYVKEVFGLPNEFTIFEINSSCMYIKKGEQAEKLYAQALENYNTGRLHNKLHSWGGGFPDELGFNVAFAQLGIDPTFEHQTEINNDTQWPVFFSTRFHNDWTFVYNNYPIIGFFGDKHFTDRSLQDMYDRIMTGHGNKLNFRHEFKMHQLMKEKHVREK